ncbi:putative OsmC-like protein [Balneicella halophila]|uniref:Putative OsmC-like protein n=1 Tax=Balneicella halophila TaxID=1537566 RepID=A0A7L4USL5_BALHA|nr:OsmC family protein [Balneicella halophila]PVX51984.1 putative OsmC-like protein [Balneicella halophila]
MATSTMKVTATMGSTFKTDIKASHDMVIDQPKAAGGSDLGANPLEYYLSGLAGCLCAITRIIANQRKLEVKNMEVNLEGDIDKAFLMGNTEEGRAGFTELRLSVKLDAPSLSKDEKEALIHEAEKRCPVADNIENETVIKVAVTE